MVVVADLRRHYRRAARAPSVSAPAADDDDERPARIQCAGAGRVGSAGMGRTITPASSTWTEPDRHGAGWRETSTIVFARVGVELTDAQLATWACASRRLVDYRYRIRPWNGIRPTAVERESSERLVEHVRAHGAPCSCGGAIHTARDAGLRVAIASSSSRELDRCGGRAAGHGELVDAGAPRTTRSAASPKSGVYSARHARSSHAFVLRGDRGQPLLASSRMPACEHRARSEGARGRHQSWRTCRRLAPRDHAELLIHRS